jgi:predicted ABC-type ATPase
VSTRFDRPKLWIVAGPNGSGKSSLYTNSDIEDFAGSVWIINPDVLSARILQTENLAPVDANLAAVKRIGSWLEASIDAYQTIGVETVLSTDKYRVLVSRAKAHDFEVRLIYVVLASVAINIERIRLRVAKGGHDVPPDKIVARRERSLAQLPWFLEQADRAWIFDNSGATPRLIGDKRDGEIVLDPAALSEIVAAVQAIKTD